MKHIVYLLGLLSISFFAQAAELKLQAYPNAREVFHATSQENSFLLALGSYKKIDSSWIVDRSQHLSGGLERFTYELPADHNAENGFLFFRFIEHFLFCAGCRLKVAGLS